jgi:ATP-binding cassette subfamily A (ABC1) protein 1
MDKYEIDGTTRLEDYIEIPLPRNDPREGMMRYFTSGFIFLQDRIEQAIIKIQTNQDQLPEMYMNQIPGNDSYSYYFFLFIKIWFVVCYCAIQVHA